VGIRRRKWRERKKKAGEEEKGGRTLAGNQNSNFYVIRTNSYAQLEVLEDRQIQAEEPSIDHDTTTSHAHGPLHMTNRILSFHFRLHFSP